jgi:8-oxo-dGTP pyrophosphatase MutT (NUDIX family)
VHICIAGCIVDNQDKILILHRIKTDGDVWRLPAGSMDDGEDALTTAVRELYEETRIETQREKLEYLGIWTEHLPDKTVEFTGFKLKLDSAPTITLSAAEHDAYAWVTPAECHAKKDLIHTLARVLEDAGYVNGPCRIL